MKSINHVMSQIKAPKLSQ